MLSPVRCRHYFTAVAPKPEGRAIARPFVVCSTSMPRVSKPYDASRSERAVTALPHVFLDSRSFGKGRHRLADDRIIREEVPRLFLEIGIPDRADAGVVPADDVIAIVRSTHVLREGSARDKGRGGDGDGCTESGNATHERSPHLDIEMLSSYRIGPLEAKRFPSP